MESRYFVVNCLLRMKERLIEINTFIDCRAMEIVFVDKDFVCHH
jgi:hypothetical protein